MRPLKLKIKGLNSFIEIQEIDFTRLTSKGLFGIFGPTGSGKSTILDGITLALYGEIARKSSNFMNTNCDNLNISFEFQISEKESKRYRVEREFRRNKKTGTVNTHSAKILQLTEVGEIVLEEQVREVNKKCEEIIGLKLDDFMRTVVLPQGKFSEFLRLEGRERREMLERLFNLQKYGDELSLRLALRIKQEQEKANHLAGQLKSYEDCSEEILQEKTKELTILKDNVAQAVRESQKAEEDYHKGKEVWDLQSELKQQELQKAELAQKEDEIKASETKVSLGEKSLRVKPYLDQYEDTLDKITTTQKQVTRLKEEADTLAASKKEAENQLAQARLQKDNELPALRLQEQSIIDAIEEKKKLDTLSKEKDVLQASIQEIEKKQEEILKRLEKGEGVIADIDRGIQEREERVETLQVDQEFKKKVNEALLVLSHREEAAKQVANLSADIDNLEAKINEAKVIGENFAKELKAKVDMLQEANQKLQKLLAACPGDQDKLIELQEKVNRVRDQWSKNREYSAAIEKGQGLVEKLQGELATAQQGKEGLTQEISELKKELKKLELEHLAHSLRESLVEGEACPVCGSKQHQLEEGAVVAPVNLEQLQAILQEKESLEKSLEQSIIKTQENINIQEKYLQENREKLEQLGEEHKGYDLEVLQKEFESLREGITQYNIQKTELEKDINLLSKEEAELTRQLTEQNATKTANEAQLQNVKKNLQMAQAQLADQEKALAGLKADLGVEDFKAAQEEIDIKEKEKNVLEGELKDQREKLKKAQDLKMTLTNQVSDLKESLKENTAILKEKEKQILEKEEAIKAKVGVLEELEARLLATQTKITRIEEDYTAAEKLKNQIEQQYNECHTRLQSAQSSLESLLERSQKDKEALDKVLKEEQLKDIEEAKSHLISKAEIDLLKEQIKNYQDALTKLAGAIDSLKQKLGDRALTEEQWLLVQKTKEEKSTVFKNLEESKIKLEARVKSIEEDLVQKKELLKAQTELERQLGLLKDLEKLFKGKKFVEFVAAAQLKYVSVEASKRLKEITGENYGLEVDENGKFLIRDYKNGGAQRDASTLSGGETFLASLSLALALSAQIQLKGTAPLELFFLDEGFGTLDDDLLEVVMDSLERIHHDKLSVGIISHVEAIKNRVPVKLMVTPAKAGMGGSKVSIEVS